MIRIEYRNIMRKIKICSSDDAVAVLAQHDRHFVTLLELENDTLQIQKDIDDIFENAINLGIFVDDARNLSFRRGEADHGGKQNTAQSIAKGMAVASLERFERNDCTVGVAFIDRNVDAGGLQESGISHLLWFLCVQYPRLVTPIRLKRR